MELIINGQARSFAELGTGATLEDLLKALGLQQDRVAVEQNGAIVGRSSWSAAAISDGDRFEIVHFVGGGAA
ncbi:MAG TPA: sulfur carrier protein ThiS [Acidobacteriaceae bacterium]|jgi:sulfur carrier protein|nr:sulfur carrier protein ThiS [Acidobacteriaceae bacterium]